MADNKIEYAASSALTITLAGLATDTTLLAGRSSLAINNTSDKYLDRLLSGYVTVGTSPVVGRIEIWAYAAQNDTPDYPDAIDGTDSDKTLTTEQIKIAALRRLAVLTVGTTSSSRQYPFATRSLAALFGHRHPPRAGIWVVHNTGVNLGGGVISQIPVYQTVT